MSRVAIATDTDWKRAVFAALDAIDAAGRLPQDRPIILKPNLTNADGPPVTTNLEIVAAVYAYCARHTSAPILVGEGCGSGTTMAAFEANGYTEFAAAHGIELLDFHTEIPVRRTRSDALVWKECYLPEVALEAFVVSIPVLKDHSFTVTTIAMKNMFGLAPQSVYGGSWNKSKLHHPDTHKSVVDLCLYKAPELCVVDATVALTGMHLAGIPRRFDTVLASWDPVAVDAVGSRMLGHDPRAIDYLVLADGTLGSIDAEEHRCG